MGLLFPQKPDPPRPRHKRRVEEEECAPPLPRRRSEPEAEFAPADQSIERLFATLQSAWHERNRRLERRTWARLMMRLKELPPLCN